MSRDTERLMMANIEMRDNIEAIIEKDTNVIVIVAGDHGPYLTKNCTSTAEAFDISEISRQDIQDRFGTFLAIRWPSPEFEEYDNITVLQDLFPAIIAYIFEDTTLLESRVDPSLLDKISISNATVIDGIIEGGINNSEHLFLIDEDIKR